MPRPSFADALAPHYEPAVRYCRALCARSSRIEPDDVLQDALLRALQRYDGLRDPARFKAWLFQVITRTYLNTVRQSYWRRFLPAGDDETIGRMPATGADAAASLGDRLLLEEGLATLGARERSALLLYELGGFSVDEITEIQGERSTSTVKSRLARARARLRDHVAARLREPGAAPARPLQQGRTTP